jgi:multicomponent Na+:H+ antiporter subunit B
MQSEILKIAALHLNPVLLVISLLVLYRGHNEAGGGFIGGLIAGSSFILYAIAFGVEKAQKLRIVKPLFFIGLGLLVAIISGLIGLIYGSAETVMEGVWFSVKFFNGNYIKLGTPLLFDIGVYFVVAGMLVLVAFSIKEEN